MLKYLKYVFLGFSFLAMGIGTFFFLNNKQDLKTAWDSRESMSYEYLEKNCSAAEGKYYYPCFKESYEKYISKVSLTGISIGLKFAFNFLEEDKKNTTFFNTDKEKQISYSLNYLELNNFAIANSYKRFFGFKFTYPGFISKLRDYYKEAYEFSENLIHGIRGKEGIVSVESEEARMRLTKRFEQINTRFNLLRTETKSFVQDEIQRLTDSDKSRSGK